MAEISSKWNLEKHKIKKILLIYFSAFFLVIAFFIGFIWGRFGNNEFENIVSYYQNQSVFEQQEMPEVFQNDLIKLIWGHLNSDFLYKNEINTQDLYYSAIAGFVAGLDDPFTVFLSPQITKDFDETISGEFEGIGAEIGIRDDRLTVVSPLPGSPAEKAGLMAGDKIYAIDEVDTTSMSIDEAVDLIRGPKDTTVTLLILRQDLEPQEIVITRGTIELKSVKWEFQDNGIVYVEINNFYEDTNDLFDQLIKEIQQNKPKAMILDLRNNPGGLLGSANYITSKWLDEGQVVVIERFADGTQEKYEATGKRELNGLSTIVLINQGSASGSEILAGALQDHHKATLIGETTFGKGSVQELRRLPDGSSLKMTIAEWLTPNGECINEQGIKPDIEVVMTYEDYLQENDLQLDKAVEILLNQ